MSNYEMKNVIKIMINNVESNWSADTIDMVKQELMDVYEQAAEASELRKQNGILSGQLDTMRINLDYFKKKATEYEAKAKAYDRKAKQYDELKATYDFHAAKIERDPSLNFDYQAFGLEASEVFE